MTEKDSLTHIQTDDASAKILGISGAISHLQKLSMHTMTKLRPLYKPSYEASHGPQQTQRVLLKDQRPRYSRRPPEGGHRETMLTSAAEDSS